MVPKTLNLVSFHTFSEYLQFRYLGNKIELLHKNANCICNICNKGKFIQLDELDI